MLVGVFVGAYVNVVGDFVGRTVFVGARDGFFVGLEEGDHESLGEVGPKVGDVVFGLGANVGPFVVCTDGEDEGDPVRTVGALVGLNVSDVIVGPIVGTSVTLVGVLVGVDEGEYVWFVGVKVGAFVGVVVERDGVIVGVCVTSVGNLVGLNVGFKVGFLVVFVGDRVGAFVALVGGWPK